MNRFWKNLSIQISRFLKKPFVRNVAIVASGTALAQAVTMAFSPLITRIYGPEAFGLLGIFKALVVILTPVAALTYPIAIVLPEKDADAKGLMKLSLYIGFGVFLVGAAILLAEGERLLFLLDSEAIAPYVMLIPLCMLFSACIQVAQQWLIRKKYFSITARVVVIQAFLLNIAIVGFGWYKPIGAVLVILATVGQAFFASMLWIGIKKTKTLNNIIVKEELGISLTRIAMRYYDFPLYRAPQVFINALSQSLPVLMLASFFGPASAGFYAICKTVLGLPSRLIGKAVADVFYPRITEAAHNGENLFRLILKATLALATVGFVPFAVVVAFGPQLFSFVFGPDWIIAGEYARWLALWMFSGFVNRPSVAAISTLSMQGFFLVYELASIGLRVASLAVGVYMFEEDTIAIALFSIVGLLLNASLILATMSKTRR